ncbi:hypothetical protein LOTGIDRAFT_236718 [Lottia gigantea]|uniref:Chitin-binding type-2 domain-containing protein n=1 Tax=Lottia gigantea TaxID=225164 RepID=V3ZQU9_LOTGI|nr:hypothetical protein LOTGIDRAFT_236718 [Lottia gigantea]ESO83271.1 hypothetical protein LOTGIDRAFT_236718 [Lottia gigantea]
MRNGVGFNSVAGSCQKFIQCIFNLEMLISTILKDCPAGLFWDQDKLTCNYASEVDCTEDPCYSKPDGDIAHPTNCREYYTCFNSVSFEKCCLPGYAFNAAAGKCESNSACVDSCKWGNPEEGCTRREIADKHSYEQAVGDEWIVMSCPLGALYSQEECKCGIYDEDYVNTPPPPAARDAECKPSVQLSFDSGTYDESGNFNYVQNNGVVVESGVAYFDGQSFLRIPRFANVDFRKTVTIKMKYKLDGAATGQEALVTNGDCGEKQSIYIVAEQSQTVLGLISADSADEKSATIASSSDWNEVEYKVVDGELISAVNGRQANTIVDGIIKRKHCSLQIGRGDGFDNFKGWIDELSVYLCAA